MVTETKFLPNSDRVLVEPEDVRKKYAASGLHIPESIDAAQAGDTRIGTVLAVGPGRFVDGVLSKPPFVVGDIVVLDPVGGLKVKIDGSEMVLVRSEEILGRLKSADKPVPHLAAVSGAADGNDG